MSDMPVEGWIVLGVIAFYGVARVISDVIEFRLWRRPKK